MPPPWAEASSANAAAAPVRKRAPAASSRKLSIRLKSDQKETKEDRLRRRAAASTGAANVREEGLITDAVSRDIAASFEVKKKKAQLPQWMIDLRTPVKAPKLPAPQFYGSPDELMRQASIDEWARVSRAALGETGILVDDADGLDYDAATQQCRDEFRVQANEAIKVREKEVTIDTTNPRGSIFFDDWSGRVHTRLSKTPNATFKRREGYFSALQKRRPNSLIEGSGEYARLLLEITGSADSALRDKLWRIREKRLKALTKRVKRRMVAEHLEALREYIIRCKKVKDKFARMLAGVKRLTFNSWKTFAWREKKIRRLRIKVFMHLQLHVVETWSAVTNLNRARRRWFHDWKDNAQKQIAHRNKIGAYLQNNQLQKRFLGWAVWTKRIKAAKKLAYRVFGGSRRIHYYAWRDYTKRAFRIRAFAKIFCGNAFRDHYEAWRDFTVMSVKGRRLCGYIFAKGQKRIFIAWRRQSREDKLARLRAEAAKAGDDLVARFYTNEDHASLHKKPSGLTPTNRVRRVSNRRAAAPPPGWDPDAEFTYVGPWPRPPPLAVHGGLTPQTTPRITAVAPARAPAPAPASSVAVVDAVGAIATSSANGASAAAAGGSAVAASAPVPRFSMRGWSQPTTGMESKYAPDVWNALNTPLDNPRRKLTRQKPTDAEVRALVARITGQAIAERSVTGDFRALRRRRSFIRAAAQQREADALAALLAMAPASAPAPAPAPAPGDFEAPVESVD